MQIIGGGRLLTDGTFEPKEIATAWNVSYLLNAHGGAYVERWNAHAFATLAVTRKNRDEVLGLFGIKS